MAGSSARQSIPPQITGVCQSMLERLKQQWTALKRGTPGSRFEDQYDRNQRRNQSGFGRVLRVIVGVLLIPVGVFFLAVPGPGLVIIGIGAVLIAREFRFAARALDWLEVRLRRAYKVLNRLWRKLVTARRRAVR